MYTLIIIPTYNEAENILKLIEKINDVVFNLNCSILIVDDSSSDGTFELIYDYQKKYKNIYLIKRKAKMGLASAYIEGFRFGLNNGFDYFIQMDADFSHNPDYLSELIDKLKTYDYVIGSRNIPKGRVIGWTFLRKFISKGGSIYSKLILNCPINDLTGGFNGWRKDVLLKIGLNNIISKGYCFQLEMKYRAFRLGFNYIEIPIVFENRKYGISKMSFKIFIEALLNTVKLRFLI